MLGSGFVGRLLITISHQANLCLCPVMRHGYRIVEYTIMIVNKVKTPSKKITKPRFGTLESICRLISQQGESQFSLLKYEFGSNLGYDSPTGIPRIKVQKGIENIFWIICTNLRRSMQALGHRFEKIDSSAKSLCACLRKLRQGL